MPIMQPFSSMAAGRAKVYEDHNRDARPARLMPELSEEEKLPARLMPELSEEEKLPMGFNRQPRERLCGLLNYTKFLQLSLI